MGKASSSKKVAKAARASGRPGTGRNWGWPLVMVLVVALGVGLVAVSAFGGEDEASAEPTIGAHWHQPYGIYTCGEFQPDLVDGPDGDLNGIHSHGDGLIHMHPFTTQVTGSDANLGAFAETVELGLEDDRLALPGGDTFENGDDCGGEPGRVQVKVWEGADDPEGRLLAGDVADFAPQDGNLITIAFAPEGEDLPKPPSTGTVPSDLGGPTPQDAPGAEVPPATIDPTDPTAPTETTDSSDTTAPTDTTAGTAPPESTEATDPSETTASSAP